MAGSLGLIGAGGGTDSDSADGEETAAEDISDTGEGFSGGFGSGYTDEI